MAGVLIFWALVGGLVGLAIGNGKGRGVEGLILGLVLGFIGWIIVALMSPTPEAEAQRARSLAVALGTAAPSESYAPGRPCPWCAETIKPAARVCRYCGRDVEPVSPRVLAQDEMSKVEEEFPAEFPAAVACMRSLPTPPTYESRWLRELCKRMAAGSPPKVAAARIPLDWARSPGTTQDVSPIEPLPGDPAGVPTFESLADEYPQCYETARAFLAGLPEPPTNPEVWLRELCRRIDAGSPPAAAAGRIPLDIG